MNDQFITVSVSLYSEDVQDLEEILSKGIACAIIKHILNLVSEIKGN